MQKFHTHVVILYRPSNGEKDSAHRYAKLELFRYHIGYRYIGISANFWPYRYRPILFENLYRYRYKTKERKKNEALEKGQLHIIEFYFLFFIYRYRYQLADYEMSSFRYRPICFFFSILQGCESSDFTDFNLISDFFALHKIPFSDF